MTNYSEIKFKTNPYAHCFAEVSLATTGGMEYEDVKFLGKVSFIMRASTSNDGDLSSHFGNINEGKTLAEVNSTPFKQIFFVNHTELANKGKINGHLPLEHLFGFCRTFKKITKNLGFHLT